MKLEIKVALLTFGTLVLAAPLGRVVTGAVLSRGSAASLAVAAGVIVAVGYGGWKAVTRWLPARLERDSPPARVSTDRPSWLLVVGPVVFAGVVTIAAEVLQAKGGEKLLQAWGLAFAIVYNGVPGHVRRRKYLVLFSTMLCNERVTGAWLLILLAFVVVSVVAAAMTRARDARLLTPGVRAMFRLSMRASNERARVAVLVLAAAFLGLESLLLDTYRLNRSVAVLEHADFVRFLLDLVLAAFGLAVVLRYYTKDAASRRPILFLRSFDDASVPARLKQVLGPITKSAVIRCLVHPNQRASALQQQLPPSQFLSSQYATEEGWQSWVQGQLDSCAGAVFDFCSLPPRSGTGVGWEYQHAIATLPPERIAVLVSGDTANHFSAASVQTIPVRQDAQLARATLSRWADRVTSTAAIP